MSGRKTPYIVFILAALLFAAPDAYSAGTTGANFLRFGTGARPMGMGGAYAAIGGDINSAWWNPAGLALMEYNEIILMHNEAGEGIRHEFFTFGAPVHKLRGAIAASVTYFSVSDIQGYDAGGMATEELTAYDVEAAAAYGRRIFNDLSLGTRIKLIQEKLDDETALTYAADAGCLWNTFLDGLSLGCSLQNMGPGLEFIEEPSRLPLNFKAGIAYEFLLFGNSSILAFDSNSPVDGRMYLSAGAECRFFNLIALRAGYVSNDDLDNGLRVGGGVRGGDLMIDYAWMPRGYFTDSHRFSLNVRFGRKYRESEIEKNINIHFERGKKYFYDGNLLKAYREFKDILLVAPRHKGAQDFIGRIELNVESAEVSKEIDSTMAQGSRLFDEGDLTAARASFETVLALDPGNTEAADYIEKINTRFNKVVDSFVESAKGYYEKSEYDKALEEIQKALTLDPGNAGAVEYAGLIRKKKDELEKIKIALKKEQEERIKQRKVTNFMSRAQESMNRKDWAGAIENYSKVLELEPAGAEAKKNIAAAYYSEGLALREKDDLKKAALYMDKASKYDPALAAARTESANIKEALGEKAKEYNRNGLMEYSKGNLKEAIKYLEQALEFDPELKSARENLERARKELK